VSKKYMKVQKVNKVQKVQKNKSNVTMAVALPNTGAKLDLITTKLTEVGVDHIIRWTADRSQIRQLSDKKISKLYLHIIGASEQSLRTSIPSVARVESLNDILHHASEKVVCMDMNGAALDTLSERSSLRCLIGPEG
jgi:RsmE family RNA methyltransferase